MNPQDPLASLHPLRAPLPIGWWPPAPGWWLLAALVLLALAVLAWWLRRRRRANAYRRQALAQLAQLQQQYRQQPDSQRLLADTNALLKSVALVAYPRRDVAASSGEAWLALLNAPLKPDEQFPADFVAAAYRKDAPAVDAQRLQRSAARWIRRHEVAR
ncbi:MAG: DUF4381 domain-containing protein [Pseudomonadales bacterium]|nr:DUF4381 domain-containing protein [Pseudomonadales bacterium]MCP5192079.1 DUF4381 domain-containing protein [Pseudomonadales bacterium]